ncbi:MAG: serine dehydratase beta chain, partial [Burkholderiales bacterium]
MLGALDMFGIGIGPSSSHTIGPMKAALEFVNLLNQNNLLDKVIRIQANLYGSLALTGEGHGTVLATLNGLCGEHPKTVDPDTFILRVDQIKQAGEINLLGKHKIKFTFNQDMLLHKQEFLPQHANGMRFIAFTTDNQQLLCREYFSIGGGFILDEDQMQQPDTDAHLDLKVPYSFSTPTELFELCTKHNLTIAQLVTQNELVRKSEAQVRKEALEIIEVMHESVNRGIAREGVLPGGLSVRRRAPALYKKLQAPAIATSYQDQRLLAMVYAIGVNEEN